jgi:hypothetical protein
MYLDNSNVVDDHWQEFLLLFHYYHYNDDLYWNYPMIPSLNQQMEYSLLDDEMNEIILTKEKKIIFQNKTFLFNTLLRINCPRDF